MPPRWNENRLTAKLGIDYLIIQGPCRHPPSSFTLALTRSLTGSTAFAFIKPMIVTLASEILRTSLTLWPSCLTARARWPPKAIASMP
jgi:hypothetical protein